MDHTELKSVILFNDLEEGMLKKLALITLREHYAEHDYIFRQNEKADKLFAVVKGEVELGITIDQYRTIRMEMIKPGHIFGFSALIESEQKYYTAYGKAVSDTVVFTWEAGALEKLFNEDYRLGYLFMKKIAWIAKNRLEIRNASLLDIYLRK